MLYHKPFRGLVSTGGGDAGNHIHVANEFASGNTSFYQSFVAFHAAIHSLQSLLDGDYFLAFQVAYYAGIVAVLYCVNLLAVVLASHSNYSGGRRVLFYLTFLGLAWYPAQRVSLPILHYLQSDGFFPQFYGSVLTFYLCLAYVRIRPLFLRYGFLFLGIVLLRYTYGLNLADCFITVGILSLIDFHSTRLRLAFGILSVGSICVGLLCYRLLYSILFIRGGIIATEVPLELAGRFLVSIGLLFAYRAVHRSDTLRSEELGRLCLFAGVLGAVTFVSQGTYLTLATKPTYYIYKYAFSADLIVISAAVLLGAAVVTDFATSQISFVRLTKGTAVLLPLFCGLLFYKHGYFALRPSYVERTQDSRTPQMLSPMYDSQAATIVRQILTTRNARFGGLITPLWPVSNFFNAAFGYYREWPLYTRGLVTKENGYCVFWKSSEAELSEYQRWKRLAKVVDALSQEPETATVDYVSRELGTPQKLKYLCPGTAAQ